MKKLFVLLFPLMLSSVGCSDKESLNDQVPPRPQKQTYIFEATTHEQPTKPATRIDYDPIAKTFTWEAGDQVTLYYRDANTSSFNEIKEPFVAQTAGKKTKFQATVAGTLTSTNKDYRMIYPARAELKQTINIGQEQSNGSWAQNASFDKQNNIMVAEAKDQASLATDYRFLVDFHHLTTAIRIFPKAPAENQELNNFVVSGFKIEFPENVVGAYTLDGNAESIDKILIPNRTDNQLVVKLEKPKKIGEFTPNDVLIQTLPFSVTRDSKMVITIMGDLAIGNKDHQTSDLQQEFTIQPMEEIQFGQGRIRTLNLTLKPEFKEMVKGDMNKLLGDETFAPIGKDPSYNNYAPYPNISWNGYTLVGKVRCAASKVIRIGSDNVVVLENTIYRAWAAAARLTNRSAFQMPINDVLKGYYTAGESFIQKDLYVSFEACVFFSGDQEKRLAPLTLVSNHISDQTKKSDDYNRLVLHRIDIPVERIAKTAYKAKDENYYDYPELNNWYRYTINIPAKNMIEAMFSPNGEAQDPFIGFDLDIQSNDMFGCCIYLRNITFTYANEVRIQ